MSKAGEPVQQDTWRVQTCIYSPVLCHSTAEVWLPSTLLYARVVSSCSCQIATLTSWLNHWVYRLYLSLSLISVLRKAAGQTGLPSSSIQSVLRFLFACCLDVEKKLPLSYSFPLNIVKMAVVIIQLCFSYLYLREKVQQTLILSSGKGRLVIWEAPKYRVPRVLLGVDLYNTSDNLEVIVVLLHVITKCICYRRYLTVEIQSLKNARLDWVLIWIVYLCDYLLFK